MIFDVPCTLAKIYRTYTLILRTAMAISIPIDWLSTTDPRVLWQGSSGSGVQGATPDDFRVSCVSMCFEGRTCAGLRSIFCTLLRRPGTHVAHNCGFLVLLWKEVSEGTPPFWLSCQLESGKTYPIMYICMLSQSNVVFSPPIYNYK